MKPKDFFDKVVAMREAQKEYFRTRSSSSLDKSKALEREIDNEIGRVQNILNQRKQGNQLQLPIK